MKQMVLWIAMLLVVSLTLSACVRKPDPDFKRVVPDMDGTNEATVPATDPDANAAQTADGESDAAGWLVTELAKTDDVLYVYSDFADGLNNYTQKAWMGDYYSNIPAMNEAAEGYSGKTGIMAELDITEHLWGGYMFLNGVLDAGESAPRADFGDTDAGPDLTGAEKLVFYAKGETGRERVEFFMGGLGWNGSFPDAVFPDSTHKISLGVISLTDEWQRYEILLEGVDLSRIGCGFGWVANDVNNRDLDVVRFYMDDIRYVFADRTPAPMFLQSYESAAPGTDEAIINNFSYLYDNAVAALALSYAGEHERARQIADAIVYAYGRDRYFADGRLRNAYTNGNPASFPGWFSSKGEAFARMPGFYDEEDQTWYEDYYAVSTSTGNLAWAILALSEVSKDAQEEEAEVYVETARGIGDFILTLKDDAAGGFTGGYEGWEGDQVKVGYKSTEHNIDLIAAFHKLYELTGEKDFADASGDAADFVFSMYDPERGCFYTGTGEDGVSINKDVLPLDCITWAILAAGELLPDMERALRFLEENMAADRGYDFNTDKDGVWFEGTAQAALAWLEAGNKEKYEEILAFLNESANADGSIAAADRDGLSTGFVVSGTDIPWEYGKRTHVGATAWLAFAQMGKNPLRRNSV